MDSLQELINRLYKEREELKIKYELAMTELQAKDKELAETLRILNE